MCVNIPFSIPLGSISRSGIAGSYGNSYVELVKELSRCFLKKLYHFTFLPAISPYPHLLLSFFIIVTLIGMKCYLTVVLICASLTIKC